MIPFRRSFAPFAAPLALMLALAMTAHAQTPAQTPASPTGDKVIARVDGADITEKDLEIATEDLGERLPGATDAARREALIGYVVDLKIGAMAAAEAKIVETPEFARRMAFLREKVLVDEYLTREVKKAVTVEASRKLYEETIKDKGLKPEPEVRARHILVPTEDEARKALARVKAGEDFAKVAADTSKDPGSGSEGGDLGFFSKDRMVPEFAEVAFRLEPGQLSEPVKSQFGWHVIKVEEKRMRPVPTFEDVKDQIDTFLTSKTQQELVLALRAKARIERLDQPVPETPKSPAEPAKP